MAGLFGRKKKDDTPPSNANTPSNSGPPQQQRPPPSPNGLNGINSSSGSMQAGVPTNGYDQNGGSRSPMSPSFPQNNSSGSFGQQQPPMSPMVNGPPSPLQSYNPGFSGPPGTVASSTGLGGAGAMLTTPQLFWTQRRILGTNPFPRFQHTSSIIANGTDIYLYGGSQRGTTKGDLFIIDSVSLQCQAVAAAGADPPMPKSGHTAVNIGQYIIYFGGWDSMTGQCDDSLHVLHTARREWNKPPIQGPLPTPRHSHSGCSVGTTMYIFGGQVDNYYLDDISAFDMKSITQNPHWDKIEPQTESPPARSGHCAGVFDNKIYIFGGADADYFYNDIWCFDPRALTWTPIPASGYLPTGRHGHSCTVADGVLYIFGGNSPDGTELNDAYAFKIHERRWYLFQNVGPVASPRSGHTMCTIKDRIFVLGGESEHTKQEDSALVYFLELSKVRYSDSTPQIIPARQTSQPIAEQGASGYESDRGSAPPRAPERPDRPDRPDRRLTQRPASPATFGPPERQGSMNNISISQQTSQLMNPQLGQRPLTTLGAPPPRGASSGFQSNNSNSGMSGTDYQAEGLSIATRRQTLKEDFQGGYGGAVVGTASPVNNPNTNRRTMHQMPSTPTSSGPAPSPLRVINVSPSSPPSTPRQLNNTIEETNGPNRPDRRNTAFVPPPTLNGNQQSNVAPEEDVNPYAMEAITPNSNSNSGSYVPPPGSPSVSSGPLSPPPPPPPTSAVGAPNSPSPQVSSIGGMRSGNLPPPPTTPSPPVSGSIPPGGDRKSNPPPPPPHSVGSSTPIPGPLTLDRSASPGPGRFPPGRGSNGPLPAAPSSPIITSDSINARSSTADLAKIKSLESKAGAALEENEQLRSIAKEREDEIDKMKKREHWLLTEVILARASKSGNNSDGSESSLLQDRRLSMADLEQELENEHLQGQQLKLTQALIRVREELKSAKMSIAMQAHAASGKIKEAERIRTGALQEAAYLKAKVSSLSNAQEDPGALARVETDRAQDLEKRLTAALNELEALESQHFKTQEILDQERAAKIAAEERSTGSVLLAEQAQSAHTRALAELTSLHSRAAKAEADSRDLQAQLAETQAGYSGHQSQSSGLLQKVTSLKQQVEQHEKALERTQMAYSAANERAMRAEARADESAERIEQLESVRFELTADANRFRAESERLLAKVEELETRCQVSKDEVITLRKLVEDGLDAFNPRAGSATNEKSAARKHDSIAILSTVSRVSELETELGSLKRLHTNSQAAATKSASELATAMIELSKLEQSSMQARTETISLQKQLSHEREGAAQLRSGLSQTEQELQAKVKALEDHEVQLGFLKDVMREKGLLADDLVLQARNRGTGEYAATMEQRVQDAEDRVLELEQELEDRQAKFAQQLETFEAQRQATIQHSEKTGFLLRKIKNDLEATMKEKDLVDAELKTLQDEHARCGGKEDEDERVQMLQLHWDEERRELSSQTNDLQNRLMESEMHSADLSQKVISITERLQEVESLNEAIADELESMQDQAEVLKTNSLKQEHQLQSDVERLVTEIHQVQEKLQKKQIELDEASEQNEHLESQLGHALQAQAAAVEAAASASSSKQNAAASEAALKQLEQQRTDLEQRLKRAQETIQILEGDNSVLEARLSESEKKVTLLLENMQGNGSVAGGSSLPNSPFNSDSLAGIHQQLNVMSSASLMASSPKSSLPPAPVTSASTSRSAPAGPSTSSPLGSVAPLTNVNRLLNNVKNLSGSNSNASSNRGSPAQLGASTGSVPSAIPSASPASSQMRYYGELSDEEDSNSYHQHQQQKQQKQQKQHQQIDAEDDSSDDNDDEYEQYHQQRQQQQQQQQQHRQNQYSSGYDDEEGQQGAASNNRDSVDSITRELEMLKVPWNNTAAAGFQGSSSPKGSLPPPPSQRPQQPPVSSYQFPGQQQQQHSNFYNYSDDSEDEHEEDYLSKLRQPTTKGSTTTASEPKDTHSFSDRSPSRLKEYEQMIDEIENGRIH
ncbi:Negative regulator of mitotic exit [Gryganskiella cystojenkinii]|nr:Negative regulator of mitotic exit [Gryganskiella cystojenkinii]